MRLPLRSAPVLALLSCAALVTTCDAPSRADRPAPPGREAAEARAVPVSTRPVAPDPPASGSTDASALPEEVRRLLSMTGSESTSVGGPNDGSVRGAVAFPMQGPGFRWSPVRDPIARFGTVETVQALIRAALAVVHDAPGSELTVNDLGLEHGGPIPHHGSHRAGRDVDVLFYLQDANGAPMPAVGAPLDPDGAGVDFRDLARADDDVPVRMDVPRSWRFVEALLLDERAPLQRIFLVEHLRTLLLAHARRIGAPPLAIARFSDLTCQPSYPHDDHFHFRFFCTAEDVRQGCEDGSPLYPWHLEAMARLGVRPVPARPRANRPAAAVTSDAEAREAAGPMDAAVTAWLARREAWRRQPHPGRTYCR